jgi:hypothetical protein
LRFPRRLLVQPGLTAAWGAGVPVAKSVTAALRAA